MKQKIAQILLEKKAVQLQPKEPFTYSSGMKSPIYCDNRQMLSFPEEREQMAHAIVQLIQEKNLAFDVICGIATGGIGWAAMVATKLNKPMIYVRGKAKEHGKQKRVEGVFEKGQKILIIEDLISTGGSSLSAIGAVREEGGIVDDCIAIFSYNMAKAREGFTNATCNLHTLTNFPTLVTEAVALNKINEGEKDIVLGWSQDPHNWAAKHDLA